MGGDAFFCVFGADWVRVFGALRHLGDGLKGGWRGDKMSLAVGLSLWLWLLDTVSEGNRE